MAQPLQNISISAPGFLGLNTEDSPLDQPQAFASVANNAIIDKFGRVGARKGYVYDTTNSTALGSARGITTLYEFTSAAGVTTFLSTGNNLILSGDATLVDKTGSAAITDDDWKIVELNDLVYFFQSGHIPLYYDPSTTNVDEISAHGSYTGTVKQGNTVLAAAGRLFVADIVGDRRTIYWSDLLQGFAWAGGTAGSIDVSKHWPVGADNIVAIVEHNHRLIVFGERSILIYSGIESPSTMALEDTIDNVGCAARDSVQSVGNDLLFLSHGGVESLSRVLDGTGNPIGGIANNVRTDIVVAIDAEVLPIKSVYSPEEQFYLITFPTNGVIYCFDMRRQLDDGSYRTTTWSAILPLSFHRCTSATNSGQLRMGMVNGISTYKGYNDNATSSYVLDYLSNPMDFDSPANLKFLKKLVATLLGQGGTNVMIKWSYDYASTSGTRTITLSSQSIAEFGLGEFGLAEFTAGVTLNTTRQNTDGSGINVSIGLEAVIDGSILSIQQLDVHALMGRLY
jgi:hypothetical protein